MNPKRYTVQRSACYVPQIKTTKILNTQKFALYRYRKYKHDRNFQPSKSWDPKKENIAKKR